MSYKERYEVLGTIVSIASNGLSVYKKGANEGQISGGSIGDVVVRDKGEDSFASVKIIDEAQWETMPKNEAEEDERSRAGASGAANAELAKARGEIESLKAQILENKAEVESFKEECARLQERISVAAGENLELTQRLAQLEAENKKLKEAAHKKNAKGDKPSDAPKTGESQDLNLGGNE